MTGVPAGCGGVVEAFEADASTGRAAGVAAAVALRLVVAAARGDADLLDRPAVAVAGVSPVPANATAAIVNVTSVDATAPAFITVWPTGTPMPTASTLNPLPGIPVPNLAYLKLGTGGQLSVFNNTGSTHYIVDVFGYIVT